MIGILDLRSLGYYKKKQGVLQQNLNKYYQFQEANKVCEKFNKMVEVIKEEEGKLKEKYPWLDDTDERKYMTDREILEKYIDLKDSCLDDSERKQVMEILYDYKDVFSLRDEIGTCLSIEVNIEVTDNSPFFIGPYHVKEEDRVVLDKDVRRLCYLGILKNLTTHPLDAKAWKEELRSTSTGLCWNTSMRLWNRTGKSRSLYDRLNSVERDHCSG